mgnify:CR=1 FL=1
MQHNDNNKILLNSENIISTVLYNDPVPHGFVLLSMNRKINKKIVIKNEYLKTIEE